jgi:hypothetical protein
MDTTVPVLACVVHLFGTDPTSSSSLLVELDAPGGSDPSSGRSRLFFPRVAAERRAIDTAATAQNNNRMTRPEAVRRVKSYSSATGYVYQYYFYEVQKTRRGGAAGTEYVYMVSLDRKKVFPLRVFVRRDGIEKWGRAGGRDLTGTEEYAVAKMRLFDALDEIAGIESSPPDLVVDESNIDTLLARLNL